MNEAVTCARWWHVRRKEETFTTPPHAWYQMAGEWHAINKGWFTGDENQKQEGSSTVDQSSPQCLQDMAINTWS